MAKRKKVLVVEDDTFLSGIYNIKLKCNGYDVAIALDGEDGI